VNFTVQNLAGNSGTDAIVRVLNQLQQQLQGLFASLASSPVAIPGVALVAGQVNMVKTGLTKPLVGWSLTRLRAESIVWDSQDFNGNAAYLALWCSANVTVDLEVF
jgi:hypothetical protein